MVEFAVLSVVAMVFVVAAAYFYLKDNQVTVTNSVAVPKLPVDKKVERLNEPSYLKPAKATDGKTDKKKKKRKSEREEEKRKSQREDKKSKTDTGTDEKKDEGKKDQKGSKVSLQRQEEKKDEGNKDQKGTSRASVQRQQPDEKRADELKASAVT